MSTNELQLIELLYDEIEQAIICDFFDIPRPEPLRGLDLLEDDPDASGVRVRDSADGFLTDHSLGNAVARIALTGIQRRLPQCGLVRDGQVELLRRYDPARNQPVQALPIHLFTINWADSGPGVSWPEAYYRAYLPGFDRHVVIASQDCTDVYGYTDETIGWFRLFRGTAGMHDGISNLITSWWRDQLDGWDQARWAYLLDTGEVNPRDGRSVG